MKIVLQNLAKRFRYEWVFRKLDYSFESNETYAILGANGSGKSTLLKVISGLIPPSSGEVSYQENERALDIEYWYQKLVWAAPYVELIEEFTLIEQIQFHQKFKKFIPEASTETLVKELGLSKSQNKAIKYFSSGMKQRLRLGLAFYSESPVILLDEPTSNLDSQGIDWYRGQIQKISKNRLLIIASNQAYEYDFCSQMLKIDHYKS